MIKNVSLLLGILFLLLSAAPSATAQEKFQSIIKGRVVDDKGQPVKNANITFDVTESLYDKFCWVKNNAVWSDENGNFVHEEYCGVRSRNVFLYIVQPLKRGHQVPIFPPFDGIRDNNVNFAGLIVSLNGNEEVNLGDVQIQVYYNTINLIILDDKSKPYFKTQKEWSNFKLLLKDESGNFAGSEAMSKSGYESTVNLENGTVKLALPEGKWSLELLKEWEDYDDESGKTKQYLAKTTVTIRKDEKTKSARLIVGESKQNVSKLKTARRNTD